MKFLIFTIYSQRLSNSYFLTRILQNIFVCFTLFVPFFLPFCNILTKKRYVFCLFWSLDSFRGLPKKCFPFAAKKYIIKKNHILQGDFYYVSDRF